MKNKDMQAIFNWFTQLIILSRMRTSLCECLRQAIFWNELERK